MASQAGLTMDHLLLPFLQAVDAEEEEHCLVRLIEGHAAPIIRRILSSSLRFQLEGADGGSWGQGGEDLFGDVVVNLLRRLRHLKADRPHDVINDFRGYVAATTYNACHLYLRRKYPQRCRVRNRLHYLLTHHRDFGLWVSPAHGLLCGLAGWGGRDSAAPRSRLEQIRQNPRGWAQSVGLAGVSAETPAPARLLGALFEWAGEPIELEELVSLVAGLWGVRDQPGQSLDEVPELAESQPGLETCLEQRELLGQLWTEICRLPLRQRTALLLNLRDSQGRDLIAILPYTGTASIVEIAAALDIPPEEFARLWNDLPLDDATIAQLLGATRQQVINLRKCARERLERRMGAIQRVHLPYVK